VVAPLCLAERGWGEFVCCRKERKVVAPRCQAERGWGEFVLMHELIPPAPFSFNKKKGETAVSKIYIRDI